MRFRIAPGLLPSEIAARAYVAALLDGEGYIGAIRRSPSKANKRSSPGYSIRVSVQMTERGSIDFLARFCGLSRSSITIRRARQSHHSDTFVFDLENHRAIALLDRVLPFLIVKRKQAKLALRLWRLRQLSKHHRTKIVTHQHAGFNRGDPYRVRGLSDSHVARCDALYRQMRRRIVTNNGIGL